MSKKIRLIKPFPLEDGCGDIVGWIPINTIGSAEDLEFPLAHDIGDLEVRFEQYPDTLFIIPSTDLEFVGGQV